MALYYKESGNLEGDLLVFLHGGGVSSWMWDKQISYFSGRYHCLAPDLPEHGQSNGTPFSIENSAIQVQEIIQEKAQGKKVTVIGFSLGAQVTVQLLSMHSKLVDYAIINSALVRPMAFAQKMIKPSVRMSIPLTKQRWFAKLQAKQLYIGEDYFEQYFAESSQIGADALVRVLAENMSFSIPESYSQSAAKILVTVGKKEKAIMRNSAYDLINSHAHAKGVVLPEVGHGISLYKPELFNQIVEAWVNERELPNGLQYILTNLINV